MEKQYFFVDYHLPKHRGNANLLSITEVMFYHYERCGYRLKRIHITQHQIRMSCSTLLSGSWSSGAW